MILQNVLWGLCIYRVILVQYTGFDLVKNISWGIGQMTDWSAKSPRILYIYL